ncbi:hypothetical protein LEP1GSC060_0584 [Leptospira weilii serovar Ranarum str. ICFT]|uniref:Uncharacterized protein n=1 Tax=Leptospira weilii serovar Ranarum str. ICFT TaxID=1218598 RepID=N1WEL2_9LEPT|nr:hypothetical protein [Leptospira weilii]EMY78686.1 hypothetical protein LEP1GSC060_0584 [Leptospira weilii serovar Ranarum str. ICFT]
MEPQNRTSKTKPTITLFVLGGLLLFFIISAPFWALNGEYGAVLFITFPFSIGLLTGFIISLYTKDTKRVLPKIFYAMAATVVTVVISILVFLSYGKEGVICIVMAFPLVYVPLLLGALFGSYIQKRIWSKYFLILMILLFNVSAHVYDRNDQKFEEHEVETWIEVNSSKKEVWDRITSPFEFGEAENFFLRNGVSYPISMRIEEQNGNRLLYCVYTNGTTSANVDSFLDREKISFTFPEPQVTMKETSFYGEVEPKHIRGKIWAVFGEFRLVEVSENKTKVVATTGYVNNLGPKFYWELWEDYLLDEVHRHVLVKIKNRVEQR